MFEYVVTRHILIGLITIHIAVFLNFLADKEISFLRGEIGKFVVCGCVFLCAGGGISSPHTASTRPV